MSLDLEKLVRALEEIFGIHPVNREGFIGTIQRIWSTIDGFGVEEVAREKTYVFYSRSIDDRDNIVKVGPWSFDNQLLVLTKPEGVSKSGSLDFTREAFWMRIHKVPIMTDNVASFLGNIIRTRTEVDPSKLGGFKGKYLSDVFTHPSGARKVKGYRGGWRECRFPREPEFVGEGPKMDADLSPNHHNFPKFLVHVVLSVNGDVVTVVFGSEENSLSMVSSNGKEPSRKCKQVARPLIYPLLHLML
ncbi:hypothetical protein Syun_023640 [Stephania yunnanensis]|uniref:DUF4283 domain-containing protein n=1 Tax=Stephania yunnanensis TaxID=152371 RepID=A0AAP0FA05_9MAGN